MPGTTPSLSDLYNLAAQLELDHDLPVQALRERDHAIGDKCSVSDDGGRLLFWLQQVSTQGSATAASAHDNHWLSESSAAALARIIACFLGFSGMAAFLLTSGRGLVNVFVFLLLFVVVQVILCVIATVVMARTLRGRQSVVLPINPARFIVSPLS